MTKINIDYQGELRCLAEHEESGSTLLTDAPKDNQGKGEGFSPTDLVATALGTCMLTVMGIAAAKLQIDLRGTKVTVEKAMASSPSRRIASLTVVFDVPVVLSDEKKEKLIKAAMTCPVHQSLHPDVQMPIEFRWAS